MLVLFEGKRNFVFWAGLMVLGLASWVLFASIWSSLRTFLGMYFYYNDIENNLPAITSSAVFILIGVLMMKSGVTKKPTSVSQKVLLSFRGEKSSLFWVGLIVLGLASVIGFAEIWSWISIETRLWVDLCILLLDEVSIMVGPIVFILIGLLMIKSGVKKE